MEIKFDIPFRCPENIAPHLQRVFHGEYDVPLAFINPSIVDLGANMGSFTLWALHRFPGAQIFSYEPHPETFRYLEQNTKPYPQIRIYNHGIGTPGERFLHEGRYNAGEASFHSSPDQTGEGVSLEVMSPLSLPSADILKLDIEGCEMEVLEPLLSAGRDYSLILLEWHSHSLRERIEALLSPNYNLIGADVQNIKGRGVNKYLNKKVEL